MWAYRRMGVTAFRRMTRWELDRIGLMRHMSTVSARSRNISPMSRIGPIRSSGCASIAETPPRFLIRAGTIGATKPTLVPATNKSGAHYTRQSVTTGLIAGSDLVIVSISGVIKKYK